MVTGNIMDKIFFLGFFKGCSSSSEMLSMPKKGECCKLCLQQYKKEKINVLESIWRLRSPAYRWVKICLPSVPWWMPQDKLYLTIEFHENVSTFTTEVSGIHQGMNLSHENLFMLKAIRNPSTLSWRTINKLKNKLITYDDKNKTFWLFRLRGLLEKERQKSAATVCLLWKTWTFKDTL